jgi:hypothetical protein
VKAKFPIRFYDIGKKIQQAHIELPEDAASEAPKYVE